MPKNVYLFYSGATDKTGVLLAEALEVKSGKTAPKGAQSIVIGWGAKTDKDINLGKATVINHPNNIRTNRNKFRAMEIMRGVGVHIAPFEAADNAIAGLDSNSITLPVIGRTNYHQGGANFFTCLTKTHVANTIKTLNEKLNKKGYFQNYIDVESEFRLHIVDGRVIYAQRKKERDNLKEAYSTDQMDKIKRMAEKKGAKVDEKTLKFALDYQGSKIAGADNIIKSNTRGYKFSNVNLSSVNKDLADQAIAAVAALGLQFGAVDCVLDTDGYAWVIEVNTGPGLEGTAFKNYVQAFSDMINNILTPVKAPASKTSAAAVETDKKVSKKAVAIKASKIDPEKLRMLADMLEEADESEADAVNAVAARMFGGK